MPIHRLLKSISPKIIIVYLSVLVLVLSIQSGKNSQGLIFSLDKKISDHFILARKKIMPPLSGINQITRIAFDEEAYAHMKGVSPWSREKFAQLIEKLESMHPKVVAICTPFLGSPEEPIDSWLPDILGKHDNIVVAALLDGAGKTVGFSDLVYKSAKYQGLILVPLDPDGGARKLIPIVKNPNLPPDGIISLGTVIAYASLGLDAKDYVHDEGKYIQFQYPEKVSGAWSHRSILKIDPWGTVLRSYRYRRADYNHISLWDFLENDIPKEKIENRIVLIGDHGVVNNNRYLTPLGSTSALTVTANEIAMILDRDFLNPALPHAEIELLLLLLLGFLSTTFFLNGKSIVRNFVIMVLMQAVFYYGSLYLLLRQNLLLSPFSFMSILLGSYILAHLYKAIKLLTENQTLHRIIIIDRLTNLYSYAYLMLRLNDEMMKSKRSGVDFCFVMLDIDNFKKVNDVFGHQKGNEILGRIGELVKKGLRGYDVAARFGGDEISIIIVPATLVQAVDSVERIRRAVRDQIFYTPRGEFHVTISAGICSSGHPQVKTADDLVKLADDALYRAKASGRNCIVVSEAE